MNSIQVPIGYKTRIHWNIFRDIKLGAKISWSKGTEIIQSLFTVELLEISIKRYCMWIFLIVNITELHDPWLIESSAWGANHKLYTDFQLHGELVPIMFILFKSKLCCEKIITISLVNIIISDSFNMWLGESLSEVR